MKIPFSEDWRVMRGMVGLNFIAVELPMVLISLEAGCMQGTESCLIKGIVQHKLHQYLE